MQLIVFFVRKRQIAAMPISAHDMTTSERRYYERQNPEADPIPDEFASYEEAGEFWDTHDTTDYPEAFQTVDVQVEFRERHYEVEVDEDVMVWLRERARSSASQLMSLSVTSCASKCHRRRDRCEPFPQSSYPFTRRASRFAILMGGLLPLRRACEAKTDRDSPRSIRG